MFTARYNWYKLIMCNVIDTYISSYELSIEHACVILVYMYGYVCIYVHAHSSGDAVSSSHTGLSYEVAEVGLLQIKRVPTDRL